MALADIPAFVSFASVAELGSFTAAAARLHISKAAVSRHLARLELRAGAKLLNRTTRHISLTTAGRELYESTLGLTAEVREIERLLSGMASRPTGLLRLTAPPIFVSSNLMEIIPQFLDEYPDVMIDINLTNRHLDPTREPFDIAVRAGARLDHSLKVEPITTYRMTICGAPSYFERRGVPARPGDLHKHECILQTQLPEHEVWQLLKQDVRVTGRLRANTAQIVRRGLLGGFGIAYLAQFVVNEDIEAGRLVSVLDEHMPQDRHIYLAYPPAGRLPAKTRAFVKYISEAIAKNGLSWSPYSDRRLFGTTRRENGGGPA